MSRPNKLQSARQRIAQEFRERRTPYHVMPMLMTADGKGPATLGRDAEDLVFEVWDMVTMETVGTHEHIADAIADAIERSGP